MPWSRERIIESILTRTLNNEVLDPRTMQSKSLAAAGERLFGTWGAALVAAGLDPKRYIAQTSDTCRTGSGAISDESNQQILRGPEKRKREGSAPSREKTSDAGNLLPAAVHKPGDHWSDQGVLQAILARFFEDRMMHGTAVRKDDVALFQAARRRHGSWSNALLAAGLDPDEFRRYGAPSNKCCQTRSSD